MTQLVTSRREGRLWLWGLVVITAIYATIGRVPAIAAALRDRNALDNTFFGAFVVVVVALVAIGLSKRPGPIEIGVGVAVLAVYGMAFLRFGIPEERTHLVEFGVVAVLFYLALVERQANGRRVFSPALLAFALAVGFGVIDELIQLALPNRRFDVRDIGFNVLAALLAIASTAALRWARRRADAGSG